MDVFAIEEGMVMVDASDVQLQRAQHHSAMVENGMNDDLVFQVVQQHSHAMCAVLPCLRLVAGSVFPLVCSRPGVTSVQTSAGYLVVL